MSGSPESVPTTEGYLVVDEASLRIEADLEQFLEGQTARWDEGDAADRLLVLVTYLVPLALFWAAAAVYDPTGVGTVLVPGLFAVLGLGLLSYHVRLGDVEIDHDAVEAVELDLGERTVDLEYTDYRPTRWATPDQSGYSTTLRFPSDEAAERARTVLAESGLADRLDVTEADDGDVETDYRVDVEDGVLFCESCGTQVSPADERCPTCDYGLRPDVDPEPPSGAPTGDEERHGTVETVYRVETERGVPFCENCGAKVSPTDDDCRSCGDALRVERAVATEDRS